MKFEKKDHYELKYVFRMSSSVTLALPFDAAIVFGENIRKNMQLTCKDSISMQIRFKKS